jgi:phage shock protein C
MSTQTRRPLEREHEPLFETTPRDLELEAISDDDLESMLFSEQEEEPKGFFNLPTMAGLSLILVGIAYLFQEMGISTGWDVRVLVEMLPWLAGILIILLGFGVLSWRPKTKKKVKKGVEIPGGKQKMIVETVVGKKKRLTKSRNKKVLGVAGGVAEYFSIDPTVVRIAFIIGVFIGSPVVAAIYLLMAYILPPADSVPAEQRITILQDR